MRYNVRHRGSDETKVLDASRTAEGRERISQGRWDALADRRERRTNLVRHGRTKESNMMFPHLVRRKSEHPVPSHTGENLCRSTCPVKLCRPTNEDVLYLLEIRENDDGLRKRDESVERKEWKQVVDMRREEGKRTRKKERSIRRCAFWSRR